MNRPGTAAGLLTLGALGLAAATAVRSPAAVDVAAGISARDAQLGQWVNATAPAYWASGLLLALAAAAAPVTFRAPSPRQGRIAAAVLALLCVLRTAHIAWDRMDRIPHVFDEFNYLFQAKNFAGGQLAAPVPPHVEHFNQLFFVIHDGRWYGSSLPGHPLVLALGVLAGVPWLVSPMASGLTLLVLHRLLERIHGTGIALAGTALLAASPFFQILSSVYLAHGTALLCVVLVLHFGTRFLDQGRLRDGSIAAAAGALGFLARPQAILAWLLPLGAWGLLRIARRRTPLASRLGPALLALALPVAPFAAFELHQNHALTGRWTDTPRSIVSPSHRLGFGEDVGTPLKDGSFTGHTPGKGLANLLLNARLLQRELYGWWGASLLLLPFSLAAVRRHPLVAASWAALTLESAVYFAYFNPSPLYGPRYFFELLPGLVLLTLHGALVLARLARRPEAALRGMTAGLGAMSLMAVVLFQPAHLDRYQPPKATAFRNAVDAMPPGRALILVPPGYFTMRAQSWNDPDLRAERIVAADFGERANRALLQSHPDRRVFRFVYDRATDRGELRDVAHDRLRLLVVGIDAATWTVLAPMMARGELPTLARLCAEGACGPLETLRPTLSPSIWTTMATGVPPERHGITGFVEDERPEELQITSDRRRTPALWDMLGQLGHRSVVLNYWCTWPAEPIRGLLVSDRATVASLPHRVAPPALLPVVERALGLNVTPKQEGLRAAQHAGIDEDRLTDLAVNLLDREPGALGIVYYRKLDILQHESWRYVEPDGFDVPAGELAAKADLVPAACRRYDGYLGRFLEQLGPDGTLMVVSDHGMESAARLPPERVLQGNRLLERLGLLVFSHMPMVDRERSTATAATVPLHRDLPVEVIRPADAERVRERLAAVTMDGAPLFSITPEDAGRLRVRIARQAASGTLAWPGGTADLAEFVKERRFPMSGQHENGPPGILAMRGPGILAGVAVERATVQDIAPTVLTLLGLPGIDGASGRALTEVMAPELSARLPPTRAYHRPPPVRAELPEGERAATMEELRGLGYIQ